MPHANSDTVSYPAPDGDEPVIILRGPGADLAPDGVVNPTFIEEIEAEAIPEDEKKKGVQPSPGNSSGPSLISNDNSKTNSGKRTSAR